jgi:hypothetical protein
MMLGLREDNLSAMPETVRIRVGKLREENVQIAADFRHGHTQLSLLQGKDNPLFGES